MGPRALTMAMVVHHGSAKASAGYRFTGFFCCVLAVLSASPVNATTLQSSDTTVLPIVRSMTVVGNEFFSRSEIISLLTLREGASFSQESLDHSLLNLSQFYRGEGFLFMSVDSASVSSPASEHAVDIMLSLREGKPAVLRSFAFHGNAAVATDELMEEIQSTPGERFRQTDIEIEVQSILQRYERSGYPFAVVSIGDVQLNEEEKEYAVDIVLTIEEGEAVRVSGLTVEGNSVTKESVIQREARLQPGELFHPDLPRRIQQRLQRLQLFSSVSLPLLVVRDDGMASFRVSVTEGSPNRFDGVVGYVPSSRAGESGYVTGLAHVQFRSLFGTGRKLSARWHRENRSTQEIELRYREPWVASYPINADVGFYQRKQDSSYVRRSYDVEAEFMLTEEFRFGASLEQQEVVPTEGLAGLFVTESRTTSVGGFLFYDSRDDAVTPTQGFVYRMDYRTGSKKRSLAQMTVSTSTQRFGLDIEYYLPVFSRQVFGTAVHAREFRSGGIEISDLFRLGGTTTVRGYREGQFVGSRAAWSNLEYRFLTGQRSFLYLFMDVAYISAPDLTATGTAAGEQTKVGYGAGLRLDTALGLIGVSLALGEGDTFSTAKLHLRLENEF